MTTLFEQAVKVMQANIAGDATVIADGATVARARIGPWQESDLPAYILTYGPDVPLGELGPDNVRFIDWEFVVFVDYYNKLTTANIDNVLQQARANIHRALMADVTQGANFILTTIPSGADEPLIDDAVEKKTIAYRTNWVIRLRTSIDDIETI
jgi:hypothetical protein